MIYKTLPVPSYFDPNQVGKVWKVPYQERAREAELWAKQHYIRPAVQDAFRVCLMLIDVQNTFCIPEFELYVAGRSGTGAVDDNRRLCEFIYRNLGTLTQIAPTMDTHQTMQIFHSVFLINAQGEHPPAYTLVSVEDIEQGVWKFNAVLARSLNVTETYAQRYLLHYVQELKASNKYNLTIWPYHALLGGIGHALVSAVEEAIFFHSVVRYSAPNFKIKGEHPFTENYSVLKPEVLIDTDGNQIARKETEFIEALLAFDAIIIAGQAKSHCVVWSIADLLDEIAATDITLAEKVYLLEDCTSPVVIPGVVDYTDEADAAFQRFAKAGIHIVRSTDPIADWPGWVER
ncbi:MAG: isochorismatase [Anaerolineae bacterium]|nr:isochorismatase [Anaerolineae bacterium]